MQEKPEDVIELLDAGHRTALQLFGEFSRLCAQKAPGSRAKELVAQILAMKPEDELYDAKVTVLGEAIDHHVREEREEMFPKVRRSALDLAGLGERLRLRNRELQVVSEALREDALASVPA